MKKIEVDLVRTKVYNLLKEMILNHELKLGEKLNVRELSEKLGISFTPVRDALLQLATEGLVKVVPRVGFFVTDVDEKFIRETIETRIMMEVFCLENYFDKIAGSEELLEIKGEIDDVEKSAKREIFDDSDERLHKLFIRASGNDLIISLYEKIWDRIDLVRHLNERYVVSNREHKELIERIISGDKEGAIEKLKEHLKNVEAETIKNLYTYERS
ncbi:MULTISPECIES: GntR family transcriptional regulator [Thermotoga]|jgi:DNA-binding GntR family transcriptional regulator|uniref:Transcriptional regulator, GntR family n=3 Tax=Thermotoga TaxID=2335 RepID=D2C5U0_THEP2|nr:MULTISPECIES: GntR family transcriptional regulator [Thermotoga]KUK23620.1 MAG: Transcriptional regulator, GntR family [Thermotoga petrophila]ACB08852.1 transcriptional regulator, GntR family [Thermotoga sp. RQ2]ACM22409.1 Transcriptional regulator, GntR family [Thermotoga neapolitana DSM 4359]ADA66326.1 transcriptional regulator, GntR family [Thermotoga petrophila RKU-10]AIY87844.1 GntR family transcriptional regulator [Thermotoga sp. Cell2]